MKKPVDAVLDSEFGSQGNKLWSDLARLKALLLDLAQSEPKEITALVEVAKQGVVDSLARHGVPLDPFAIKRFAAQVHRDSGLETSLAEWAVRVWAQAVARKSGSLLQPLIPLTSAQAAAVMPPLAIDATTIKLVEEYQRKHEDRWSDPALWAEFERQTLARAKGAIGSRDLIAFAAAAWPSTRRRVEEERAALRRLEQQAADEWNRESSLLGAWIESVRGVGWDVLAWDSFLSSLGKVADLKRLEAARDERLLSLVYQPLVRLWFFACPGQNAEIDACIQNLPAGAAYYHARLFKYLSGLVRYSSLATISEKDPYLQNSSILSWQERLKGCFARWRAALDTTDSKGALALEEELHALENEGRDLAGRYINERADAERDLRYRKEHLANLQSKLDGMILEGKNERKFWNRLATALFFGLPGGVLLGLFSGGVASIVSNDRYFWHSTLSGFVLGAGVGAAFAMSVTDGKQKEISEHEQLINLCLNNIRELDSVFERTSEIISWFRPWINQWKDLTPVRK